MPYFFLFFLTECIACQVIFLQNARKKVIRRMLFDDNLKIDQLHVYKANSFLKMKS